MVQRRSAPPVDASAAPPRRDRRGRGLRTPLLPAELPASRTRAERFDQAVLEAVAELDARWPGRLESLEFAVDEVPVVPADGQEIGSDEVVLDGGVPLARFLPPGMDSRGRPTKARIVVYRRPLEVRSGDAGELGDLVAEVLAELLGEMLGEPDDGDGPIS
ncbi:metallopeptidase family protein [Nakamurella sp.]|uniref:metallopeptidase family protein n=1 Tax=Nakamurella sp. TaxID=1869182 RepID=UPI003783F186